MMDRDRPEFVCRVQTVLCTYFGERGVGGWAWKRLGGGYNDGLRLVLRRRVGHWGWSGVAERGKRGGMVRDGGGMVGDRRHMVTGGGGVGAWLVGGGVGGFRQGVWGLVVIVVGDRLAAAHAVTHIVVRPHVQLVHGAPELLHPGGLAIEQRPGSELINKRKDRAFSQYELF